MNYDVIVSCAVTGAGDTADKHPNLPITPQQIADSATEAARAGATVVHCHVRDPETGKGSRDVKLYAEVVDRIRSANVDVVINLTAGMGGDFAVDEENPTVPGEGTDLIPALERLAHVEELLPDICSLDCGTLNFGEGNAVYVSTPNMLRKMAKRVQELGVKPELEVFDTGHLWFATKLVDEGLIDPPPLFQICLGIPYGAPATPAAMKNMADMLPAGAEWAGFAISRLEMPFVAQAVLLGGHVRVGLEDNLYLDRGVFATNAQLVERAIKLIQLMGAEPMTAEAARGKLNLRKRN